MKRLTKLTTALLTLLIAEVATAQEQVITFAELPAKAQTFVKDYFSQNQATSVYKDTEFLSAEYNVYFDNGTEIEFDDKGEWKEVKSRTEGVPSNIIPTGISQHVQKQFPNTFVKEIKKKRYGYEVEISNGLDLEFNTKGQFLRIDN